MKLRKITSLEVVPGSPFNFDTTFKKPDHFTSGDNIWEPGVRWQTWQWEGKCLGLKFVNKGTIEKPRVLVELYYKQKLSKGFVTSLIEEIRYLYNFDLKIDLFYSAFSKDRVLGPVIQNLRGMRPGQPSSLYEYLIIGVVLQNATVRRSIQMFRALLENFGKPLDYDNKNLWCFWSPGRFQNISEDELRALKLGYRAKYIKKIDDYFYFKNIDEFELRRKDEKTQKDELLKIYGVGPATVWYIMFDVFHRWDSFEHISPWEQKIYTKLFFNKDPGSPLPVEIIMKYISGYAPFRALAVHYIWEELWWQRTRDEIPWLEKLIKD